MGNACSVCPNGKALDLSLGATSCTSCPIGYYVSRTANANQMICRNLNISEEHFAEVGVASCVQNRPHFYAGR